VKSNPAATTPVDIIVSAEDALVYYKNSLFDTKAFMCSLKKNFFRRAQHLKENIIRTYPKRKYT
jgi:hypothetical protein